LRPGRVRAGQWEKKLVQINDSHALSVQLANRSFSTVRRFNFSGGDGCIEPKVHAGSILTAGSETKARIKCFESWQRLSLDQSVRVGNLLHAVEECFDDAGTDTLTLAAGHDHDAGEAGMEGAIANDATDADDFIADEGANPKEGVGKTQGNRVIRVRLKANRRGNGTELRN
jgi:hypothetical protein